MSRQSREMVFSLLTDHSAEPSAGAAYPDSTDPVQQLDEHPEEFKGRSQKWSDLKRNPYKMNLKMSYLAKTVSKDYLITVHRWIKGGFSTLLSRMLQEPKAWWWSLKNSASQAEVISLKISVLTDYKGSDITYHYLFSGLWNESVFMDQRYLGDNQTRYSSSSCWLFP